MRREDVARLVYAWIGRAGAVGDQVNDDPEATIDRFMTNPYPGGLDAVSLELKLDTVRPELIDLLAATGRERWAQHQKRAAARQAIAAGCPLRVAAEAAGVSHQTIANWAGSAALADGITHR